MTRVTLLGRPWRLVTAWLTVLALGNLPSYLAALLLLPPVPPIVMIRSFVVGTAIPALTAWAILRAFAGTADVRAGTLCLRRGDLQVDVPCAAIAAVRLWWIPLPLPGLATTPRLPFGIALARPGRLLDALAAGGVDVARARRHATVVWAETRLARSWWHAPLKFVVFGALPAGVLFYTHQSIAYGGPFGQWYLEGPAAYLRTLAEYWATTAILLCSYASMWRAVGEGVVWVVAAVRPAAAPAARPVVEAACALAYYGGVPVLLALRYAA